MGKPRLGKRERAAKKLRFESQHRLELIRASSVKQGKSNLDGHTLRLLSGSNRKASLDAKSLKGNTHYKGCSIGGHGVISSKSKGGMPDRWVPGFMARGYDALATDNKPKGDGTLKRDAQAIKERNQILVNELASCK